LNYRSIADLANVVNLNQHKIHLDVDLVVGIPRSGLLAASTIALALNIPVIDLESFIENRKIVHGGTRKTRGTPPEYAHDAKHVLIVDDSVRTGGTVWHATRRVDESSFAGRHTTCAVFATRKGCSAVDLYFETVASPRAFEWNLFHKPSIQYCCVDIDGVLCVDPTRTENDDGEKYGEFLLNAKPLTRPTAKIGALVTSRLEKYRRETEAWLKTNEIRYDDLVMLDLPDAESRRRLGAHGKFKAETYAKYPGAHLFIESNPHQSLEIAQLTGRDVLCFSNQQIYRPEMSVKTVHAGARKVIARGIRRAKRLTRQLSLK